MKTALAFSIGKARLALSVELVREILPSLQLVKPPEVPALLRGFLNLEGTLIPVLRLEHLLQLHVPPEWEPERDLDAVLIVARLGELEVAWMAAEDTAVLPYTTSELARLPKDHVLNNCAEYVIARQPPEPSIVLLEPSRLLYEAERQRVAQLARREQERLAEV